MRHGSYATGLALFWAGTLAFAAKAPTLTPIAGEDLRTGKSVSVNPAASHLATVVVFLSARCPCSHSHEPRLAALAHEFPGISFVGVHSNVDEPTAEALMHFEKSDLPFPVIQDQGGALANQFEALKTPHVFVLSPQGEKLFEGGVDDSHDAARAKKQYLEFALHQIEAGHSPDPSRERALGCIIRR